MIRLFTDHPRSVGETYLEHLQFACAFGARMVAGGIACFLHGILPFLFTTAGSRTVLALYDRMCRLRPDTIQNHVTSEANRRAARDRRAHPEPEYLI